MTSSQTTRRRQASLAPGPVLSIFGFGAQKSAAIADLIGRRFAVTEAV